MPKEPKTSIKRERIPPPPVGEKFGQWTVLGPAKPSPYGSKIVRWTVQCSCGLQAAVRATSLRRGESKKCETCRDSGRYIQRHQNSNWRGHGKVGAVEFNNTVKRARYKGFEIDITIEYMSELFTTQGEKCALTGVPLTIQSGKGNASIDRIDSKKGYIKGNVQWVDKRVNLMKNVIPEAEFVELCRLIYLNKEKSDV